MGLLKSTRMVLEFLDIWFLRKNPRSRPCSCRVLLSLLCIYICPCICICLCLCLCVGGSCGQTLSGDLFRSFLRLCGSHQTGGSAYQESQEVIAAIIGWGHWVTRWATFKEGLKRSGAKICKSTSRGWRTQSQWLKLWVRNHWCGKYSHQHHRKGSQAASGYIFLPICPATRTKEIASSAGWVDHLIPENVHA